MKTLAAAAAAAAAASAMSLTPESTPRLHRGGGGGARGFRLGHMGRASDIQKRAHEMTDARDADGTEAESNAEMASDDRPGAVACEAGGGGGGAEGGAAGGHSGSAGAGAGKRARAAAPGGGARHGAAECKENAGEPPADHGWAALHARLGVPAPPCPPPVLDAWYYDADGRCVW